jgi:predicted nucleotidyltransferase
MQAPAIDNEESQSLRELRRAAGLTQVELGRRMDRPQEEISRIEQRGDLRLSTLRAYVESLAGSLELHCRFADGSTRRLRLAAQEGRGSTAPSPPIERLLAMRQQPLAQLCAQYAVRRLSAFGSVLRQDFDPLRSDLDFVVEFAQSTMLSPASQYFEFKAALERLFERSVDLVELQALPETRLKRLIQRTQVPIYGEAA